jgi:hypothetical protein
MSRTLNAVGKGLASQAIAIMALLVAASGTAYAVVAKNSVVSLSIRNGEVMTKDLGGGAVTHSKLAPDAVDGSRIQDGTVAGADIDEDTLGQVPVATRSQLGGLAWASPRGSCTPSSTTTYQLCTQLTLTMPAAGRLVLIGHAGISHRNDNRYAATGQCQFRVDGVAGGTTDIAKGAGELAAGWEQFGTLFHRAPVAAGPVTVGIWCVDAYYSDFDSVEFVGFAAPPASGRVSTKR